MAPGARGANKRTPARKTVRERVRGFINNSNKLPESHSSPRVPAAHKKFVARNSWLGGCGGKQWGRQSESRGGLQVRGRAASRSSCAELEAALLVVGAARGSGAERASPSRASRRILPVLRHAASGWSNGNRARLWSYSVRKLRNRQNLYKRNGNEETGQRPQQPS